MYTVECNLMFKYSGTAQNGTLIGSWAGKAGLGQGEEMEWIWPASFSCLAHFFSLDLH